MINNNDNIILNIAIITNNIKKVKLLLIDNININIDINFQNNNNNTALILACKYECNIEIIKILLEYKDININLQNNNNDTALSIVYNNNNIEVVKLLLKHKNININLQNNTNEDIKKLLEEYKQNNKLINNIVNVCITQEMIGNKQFKINFIINE